MNDLVKRVTAAMGGIALISAGTFALMGIITAETQYPRRLHYSTFANAISNLGGWNPSDGQVAQPAADIFDWTMILAGITLVVGVLCVHATHRRKLVSIPFLLFAAGVIGVGVFPERPPYLDIHAFFSLATFVFGGLATVSSSLSTKGPLRYVGLVLGVTSLFFLVGGTILLEGTLGPGGVERWVVYPIVLWLVGYGGYLLSPGVIRRDAAPARAE